MAERVWPGIPAGCPVFRVLACSDVGEVSGADSCMATLPPQVYAGGALDVRLLGRMLRGLCAEQAAAVDSRLHHAEWTITSDPAVIEAVGACVHPECTRCRAEVDQVLAMLRDHPHRPILAGVLYWAGDRG